jgi:hypothetical protein
MPASVAQACDHRIDIGQLRLMDGAMAEIVFDSFRKGVGMAQHRSRKRIECARSALDGERPMIEPCPPLEIETRGQPLPCGTWS